MKTPWVDKLLMQKYSGPLTITIRTLDGEVYNGHFDPILKDLTLFDYVGHVCACIFTNMTTRLVFCMRAEDWFVVEFSPENETLEVQQIRGENLTIEEDNCGKLFELLETLEC